MKRHHTHHKIHHERKKTNWVIALSVLLLIGIALYLVLAPIAHAPTDERAVSIDTSTWLTYTDPLGFKLKYPPTFVEQPIERILMGKKVEIRVFTDEGENSISISPFQEFSLPPNAVRGETLIGKQKAITYFSDRVLTISSLGIEKYPHFSIQITSSSPELFEAVLSTLDLDTLGQ